MLRHSVPHFPLINNNNNQLHAVFRTQQGRFPTFCRILEALRVERQNSTPRLTSTPEQRNENINLNKYFISSSGDRTHSQSVLATPRAAAPRPASRLPRLSSNKSLYLWKILKVTEFYCYHFNYIYYTFLYFIRIILRIIWLYIIEDPTFQTLQARGHVQPTRYPIR